MDITYLTVKDGAIFNKSKNTKAQTITGLMTNVRIWENEYQGKKSWKVTVWITDEKDRKYSIAFGLQSQYSIGFFRRLLGIDKKELVTLGVSGSDQSNASFCWIKQGANVVKENKDIFPNKDKDASRSQENKYWADFQKFAQQQVDGMKFDPPKNASNDVLANDGEKSEKVTKKQAVKEVVEEELETEDIPF